LKRPLLVVFASVVLAATGSGVATAHPLGNFTINHYAGLVVRGDGATVDYVIDMAEIPAFQERSDIDSDGDGVLSAAELATYAATRCDALRSGLSLHVDGRGLPLAVDTGNATLPVGQAGLNTLRLECEYRAAFAAAAEGRPRLLELADTNYAERIGWREMTARGAGVGLETDLPSDSASARLTVYPQDRLSSPPDVRRATVRFTPSGPIDPAPLAPPNPAPVAAGRPTDPLALLIARPSLSPFGLAAALFIALGLGILHALSPGHGKTVMAAYLVGTRGTRRQALVLGPLVALSHTAGVLMLGALTLTASRVIAPERLYPYLSTAAGIIVLAIGLILVQRRVRAHRHGHEHSHEPRAMGAALSWRPLVALGLSGGIVPSASALLLLLAAIHFDQIGLGLVLIVAFGIGMAVTLVSVGLALVGASRLAQSAASGHRLLSRGLRLVPELTAVLVLLFGVGMTAQGLASAF